MPPKKPNAYYPTYVALLEGLTTGSTIPVTALIASEGLPNVTDGTKRDHLKTLIKERPELLEKIVGLYPQADTIIDLVEKLDGSVIEATLDQANRHCAKIVDKIALPILHEFVRSNLSKHISGTSISLTVDELMEFLLEGFAEFSKGAGNGLVSIAGTLNERLLMRAMKNGGMVEGADFKKTGTNSEADIVVHSHAGTKINLGVEVKSYHARERLLRGLQDIDGPKVGVGYFKDPSEFNAARTMTLLQADPAAIFMPASTLSKVDATATSRKTNNKISYDSRLYRPLEQFVTDMKHFVQTGQLPTY
jgi:hypothetical protein